MRYILLFACLLVAGCDSAMSEAWALHDAEETAKTCLTLDMQIRWFIDEPSDRAYAIRAYNAKVRYFTAVCE